MTKTAGVQVDLKYLRKLRNLTQEELARKVGTTRLTIHRWERGMTMPSSEHALRLAQALQFPVQMLVDALTRNGRG